MSEPAQQDVHIATQAGVGKFLQFVFAARWRDAHVAGVNAGVGWGGGWYATEHPRITAANACYFSQSLFRGEHRVWSEWEALWCVVLDDVGTKVDPARALGALGMPAWRIESSPGNWHWGYRLAAPEPDKALCDVLFRELGARGLCDVGSAKTGAIGYRRLPVGVNFGHPGHIVSVTGSLDPDAETWTVVDMLKAIGVEDTSSTKSAKTPVQNVSGRGQAAVSPDTDPLYRLLDELGALSGQMAGDGVGYELVGCPWANEHTGGVDTGHATYWPRCAGNADRGGFKCFHAHCASRGVDDLKAWAEAQSGKSVAAGAFDAVGQDEAEDLDEDEAVIASKKPLEAARDTATWLLGGSVYVQADTSVILPNGALLSARAFNTLYRGELRPLLTQPGEKEAPILWLIRQPSTVQVHHVVHWYGRETRFEDQGMSVFNTWKPMAAGRGIGYGPPDMWLALLRHLCSGHGHEDSDRWFTLLRDWLAVVAADQDRRPGWMPVLWSSVQGVGKDLVVVPIVRALGADAGELRAEALLDGKYNPFAGKRFVHAPEFSTHGMSRHDKAKVYNAFKRYVDNTHDTIEVVDKYMRAQRVPSRAAYWPTSNDHDAVPLEPGDRRAGVLEVLAGRLSQQFVTRYLDWMQNGDGVDSVIAHLRQVRAQMDDDDLWDICGPAPDSEDKQEMIGAADRVLDVIRTELPLMPDLIALQDPPFASVTEQVRALLGHVPEGAAWDVITRALTRLGCRRVHKHPLELGPKLKRRVWAVRDADRYCAMSVFDKRYAYRAILDKAAEDAGHNITALSRGAKPNVDVKIEP